MVPIFKDGIWKLEALSDGDFAKDKDTRYSVYGCQKTRTRDTVFMDA